MATMTEDFNEHEDEDDQEIELSEIKKFVKELDPDHEVFTIDLDGGPRVFVIPPTEEILESQEPPYNSWTEAEHSRLISILNGRGDTNPGQARTDLTSDEDILYVWEALCCTPYIVKMYGGEEDNGEWTTTSISLRPLGKVHVERALWGLKDHGGMLFTDEAERRNIETVKWSPFRNRLHSLSYSIITDRRRKIITALFPEIMASAGENVVYCTMSQKERNRQNALERKGRGRSSRPLYEEGPNDHIGFNRREDAKAAERVVIRSVKELEEEVTDEIWQRIEDALIAAGISLDEEDSHV